MQPTLDRWMYPFNASPGCRASAPVFGTLSDDSGVDSRHGQFLIGFDFVAETVTNCSVTADLLSLLATNRGPANYLLRRVSLTVTVNRDRSFVYDPTSDAYTSYFPTNHPALTPDLDPGRPVELFGANYRGGWEAATFWENGPFGSSAPEQRNCFAAGYDTNGVLVDVSNNVGKTNVAFPPFEVYPFAVGTTELVAVGDFVPSGTKLSFNLNLEDPLVREYLQSGLDRGRLRFIVSSLHVSEFGGQPDWPDFYTRDNVVGTPPTLELEGTLVEPDDTDGDGLPDDWEEFYFGSLTHNGLEDSDGDGASNQSEFTAGTDPSEPASVLRIVSFSREADGTLVLRFPYPASHRPVIERSSDAINWSAVTNPALRFYFAPGLAEWRSEVAPDSVQLYRLRVL
ncbi:MAG TPA: hypothetical protein PLX89_17255 [Verrucomicrobiota bacterium]|nr:hypothetical protein [Verrucomicrobiota bacterium]